MPYLAVTVVNPDTLEVIERQNVEWPEDATAIILKHFPSAVFEDNHGVHGIILAKANGETVAVVMALENRDESIVRMSRPDPTDWRNWPE